MGLLDKPFMTRTTVARSLKDLVNRWIARNLRARSVGVRLFENDENGRTIFQAVNVVKTFCKIPCMLLSNRT